MLALLIAGCATAPAEPMPAKGLYADYEEYLFKGRVMYGVQYYRDHGIPDQLGMDFLRCFWQAEKSRLQPNEIDALNAFARGEAQIPAAVTERVSSQVIPSIKADTWNALEPYCPDKIEQFRALKANS
jgi:hypothetical protein